MRRLPLAIIIFFLFFQVVLTNEDRFNVVLIVVDDLNLYVGAYSHPLAKTPNIDRLAAEGLVFDRAYSQFPFCNPSRSSFLSGYYPWTTQVYGSHTDPRVKVGPVDFLPEHFRARGYVTARFGKIEHPGWDRQTIRWDVAEASTPLDFRPDSYDGNLPNWAATDRPDEAEPDGIIRSRATAFLQSHPSQKPFFLAVGLNRPHKPFVAPRKYFDMYRLEEMPAPADDSGLPDQTKRELIRAYLASISFTDAQVGHILDELERLGLKERTFIILTSDHGYSMGERGRYGKKQQLFEEDVRVPLIVSGPGVAVGRTAALVELVDLYPTLAHLCRLPAPQDVEGRGFQAVVGSPGAAHKQYAFSVNGDGGGLEKSVTDGQYRLIMSDRNAQLYDFAAGLEPVDHRQEPYRKVFKRLRRQIVKTIREAQ